ncbi:MAG: alpha/beta hydrolase, partial [Thermoguttaceae bacterium]|nr:alpha/beta hydrolase [Thermoguttaceae bacterium]
EPVASEVADFEEVAEVVELDDLFASEVAEVADAEEVSEPVASDVANVEEIAEPVASDVADVEEVAEPVASDVADVEEVAEPVAEVADVANVEEVAEPVAADVADVESVAVEAEFVAVSGSAEGNDVVPVVRENEFWIVGQNGNGFYLYRLQDGAWNAKNLDEFYADAAEFATVVYAHGYQTDMSDATRDAVVFKSVLDAARRNVGSDRAFRLVVWKWDSERDAARIRIDAQSKAALADWSGKALGRFLGGVDSNADLALVGFSFGARVVGSALETLAQNGAQAAALDVEFDENDEFAFAVSGRLVADAAVQETTAQENDDRQADANEGRKIALILVAAACDLGSFETRGVYGRGATLPTDVLNVYNPNDFALKYYRHVSETRSDAQGVAPVRAGVFPNAVGKTFNINSNPTLGKRHSFVDAIGTVPTQTLGALAF